LWHHEFLNVLASYHRFDRVPLTRLLPAWSTARALFDDSTHRIDMPQALRIAGERNITAYDAQFVTLAQDRRAPLITHDRRLLRAVPDLALTARQYLERVRH
jgi:predicted nucleic acid-binding protein